MERLKDLLIEKIVSTKLKTSSDGSKIEQSTRNKLKDELTDCLYEILRDMETAENGLRVVRIKGAVGIACDNYDLGFVPVEISFTLKDLKEENDIFAKGEEYITDFEEKRKKEQEKAEKVAKALAERKAKANKKTE